ARREVQRAPAPPRDGGGAARGRRPPSGLAAPAAVARGASRSSPRDRGRLPRAGRPAPLPPRPPLPARRPPPGLRLLPGGPVPHRPLPRLLPDRDGREERPARPRGDARRARAGGGATRALARRRLPHRAGGGLARGPRAARRQPRRPLRAPRLSAPLHA